MRDRNEGDEHILDFQKRFWRDACKHVKIDLVQRALRDKELNPKDKRIILNWLRML